MADALIIEQIAGNRRRVVLGGAYLPNAGIRMSGSYRQSISHPPGGAPIRQKMGYTENDTDVAGELTDQPVDAEDGGTAERVATLEAILREGVDVRVTWGKKIDRLGLVTEFEHEWTEGDAGPSPYLITFQWHKVERRQVAKSRTRTSSADAALRTAQQTAYTLAVAAKASADIALTAAYGELLVAL